MDTREVARRIVEDEVVETGWFRASRSWPAGRRLLVLTPFELVLLRPWRAAFGRGGLQRWRRDRIVSRPAAVRSGRSSDVVLEVLDAESRRPLASLSPLDDSAVGLIARLWGMAEPSTSRDLEVSR